MMKNKLLPWIWKWHFIGGIISAPFILMLSVTGIIYLFKDNFEASSKEAMKNVTIQDHRLSYQQQWEIAKNHWERVPSGMVISFSNKEATEFISGKFSHKSSLFLNPYTGKVNGKTITNATDMHVVRKLHGELLMGKFGTLVVELIASWMVVLLLTGIFIFWPRDRGIKSLFMIRTFSRRIIFRDLHALLGFWFSLILLLILAGGLPWTDVFGSSFKWVQDQTNTGYPTTWESKTFHSDTSIVVLPLDNIVEKAKSLNLKGALSIDLPLSKSGIYSIYNEPLELKDTRKIHIDQSGKILKFHTWNDIGFLMKARMWAMAFHQGEMGWWNWLLVFITAIGLFFLTLFAVVSYFLRKKTNSWGVPVVPTSFEPGLLILLLLIILGIILPMFGASVLAIVIIEKVIKINKSQPSAFNK